VLRNASLVPWSASLSGERKWRTLERSVIRPIRAGASSGARFRRDRAPRRGIVIGIVPAEVHGLRQLEERNAADVRYEQPPGYPNEWVELVIYTHLPDTGPDGTRRSSRNHLNVLSADAIVALPGREGTDSEIWLATQYRVPVIAFGDHGPAAPHGIPVAPTIDAVRHFLTQSILSL